MNFGTPVPLLLGILLIIGAVALFFLDKLKPGYERDSDKVYAVLFLLSGIFLIGHLTMELLPSFQQLIMVGALTSLMIQNINLRASSRDRVGAQVEPDEPLARANYRAPARSRTDYRRGGQTRIRAELDRRDIPAEPFYSQPMLNGYEDRSQPRSPYERDVYYDNSPAQPYRAPADSLITDDRSISAGDRARKRRPSSSRTDVRSVNRSDIGSWGDDLDEDNSAYKTDYGLGSPYTDIPSRSGSRSSGRSTSEPGSPRRRPPQDSPSGRPDADAAGYVDYQPLNYSDNDPVAP